MTTADDHTTASLSAGLDRPPGVTFRYLLAASRKASACEVSSYDHGGTLRAKTTREARGPHDPLELTPAQQAAIAAVYGHGTSRARPDAYVGLQPGDASLASLEDGPMHAHPLLGEAVLSIHDALAEAGLLKGYVDRSIDSDRVRG